jgi:hypothetical protein
MPSPESIPSLLRELLDLHAAAVALHAHDVEFHLLSAAAHAAEVVEDVDALQTVERLARDDLTWIDAHEPEYRHSTASSRTREHRSIFEQVAVMAAGMRARIDANHKLRRANARQSGLSWPDEPARGRA